VILSEHDALPFLWSEADHIALTRLRQATGADVLTADVVTGRHVLRAGAFVGVLRLGDRPIELHPRLFRPPDLDSVRPAAAVAHSGVSESRHGWREGSGRLWF